MIRKADGGRNAAIRPICMAILPVQAETASKAENVVQGSGAEAVPHRHHDDNRQLSPLVSRVLMPDKRLSSLECRMVRMAETCKVPRSELLKEYQSDELYTEWLERVGRPAKFGWKKWVNDEREPVLRAERCAQLKAIEQPVGGQLISVDRRLLRRRCP